MEVNVGRITEPVEMDAIRIGIHDHEFLLKQTSDGLHIIELTDKDILVRPQVANSIVIVTKTKQL